MDADSVGAATEPSGTIFPQCPRGAWGYPTLSAKATALNFISLSVTDNSSILLLANEIALSYRVV